MQALQLDLNDDQIAENRLRSSLKEI